MELNVGNWLVCMGVREICSGDQAPYQARYDQSVVSCVHR